MHLFVLFQISEWLVSILMDIKSGHFGDNEDLNKYKTNYRDNKNDFDIGTDYNNNEESIFLEVAAHQKLSLLHPHRAIIPNLDDDIVSIAKFDIMQSSLPADAMIVSLSLLSSEAN